MIIRFFKEKFKKLQKTKYRWIVAFVATIQQSIKNLSLIYIYIDKEGDWNNFRKKEKGSVKENIIIVSPNLNVSSYNEIFSDLMNTWCYKYIPQSGDIVLDIGSGIGDQIILFSSLVGPKGLVIAIEAHPEVYRCLNKTIIANKLKNVLSFNIAVTDQQKKVYISSNFDHITNSILNISQGICIEGYSLDYFFESKNIKLPKIDLLKMNIEGAEAIAFRGMNNILKKSSNVVISCHDFVVNNHGGNLELRTSEEVKKKLINLGYDLFQRNDSLREEIPYYIYGINKSLNNL
jgi:FkbM family methyltransferase